MAHRTVSKLRWLVVPLCAALLSACGTQMTVSYTHLTLPTNREV